MKVDWLNNELLVKQLAKIAKNITAGGKDYPSSLILSGPEYLGKKAAKHFAATLFCLANRSGQACGVCAHCRQLDSDNFPDLVFLQKEEDKRNISVEAVRDFIGKLNLSVFNGTIRLGIVKQADCLNEAAANALLKTLEEPQAKAMVILLVDDLSSLPKTIVSRSQVFVFKTSSRKVILDDLVARGADRLRAKDIAALSDGKYFKALNFFENETEISEQKKIAEIFWSAPFVDLSQRVDLLDKLALPAGAEGVKQAERVLMIWRMVLRDCLCLACGVGELIAFSAAKDKLSLMSEHLGSARLVNVGKRFMEAKRYLAANTPPKIVLENLLINFDLYA